MGDLTPHFSVSEFACRCGCGLADPSPLLVDALEALRACIDMPLRVLSGRRCAAYNRRIGGAEDSRHLHGDGADVTCDLPMARLYLKAAGIPEFHFGGIGIYPGRYFLHLDVRGRKARWAKVNGVYVPFLDAWDALKREVAS